MWESFVNWLTGLSVVRVVIGLCKAVGSAVKRARAYMPSLAQKKAEAAKIEAQGKAEAAKIKAEAEAEAVKIKAEAEADAAKARAQTEADVRIIEARGIIEVDDMLQSGDRLTAWQQHNTKSIAHKAEKMEPGGAQKFRNMNKDWVADYLDKCKNYSDEEMQSLWAKILAGEAGNPGSFSKSTVDAVSKMEKDDALLFAHFCQFVWTVGDDKGVSAPLIYSETDDIYNARYHMFDVAKHLEHLRLLSFDGLGGYVKLIPTSSVQWAYHGTHVNLEIPQEQGGERKGKNTMAVGLTRFTKAGQQLYRICGVEKNDAFFQYTLEKWRALGYNPVIQEKGAEE